MSNKPDFVLFLIRHTNGPRHKAITPSLHMQHLFFRGQETEGPLPGYLLTEKP